MVRKFIGGVPTKPATNWFADKGTAFVGYPPAAKYLLIITSHTITPKSLLSTGRE